jgi:microcystin-dependent protein
VSIPEPLWRPHPHRGSDLERGSVSNVALAPGVTWDVGDIKLTARSSAPTNWLLCDGTAISRTVYALLFAAIGTTYGVGDGSTTFNVPNLKGRAVVMRDAAQVEFDVLGETGGAKTMTTSAMPVHDHGGVTGNQDDDHTHSGVTDSVDAGASDDVMRFNYPDGDRASDPRVNGELQGNTNLSHTHPFDTEIQNPTNHTHGVNPQGLGTAGGNMPPYMVLNYVIRTAA